MARRIAYRDSENERLLEFVTNNFELPAEKVALIYKKRWQIEISSGKRVSMDSQGMAMLKMDGDKIIEISVADPSRKLNRHAITVPGIYSVTTKGCFSKSDSDTNSTLILVDLPQEVYSGKSVTVKL